MKRLAFLITILLLVSSIVIPAFSIVRPPIMPPTNRPTVPPPATERYPAIQTNIRGHICGTDVTLDNATISGDKFSIYTGDSWAFNPSLLFFFLLEEGIIPNNQSFSVDPAMGSGAKTIHVHYRWKDPNTGEIKSGVMMRGYRLQLTFGQ